MSVLVPGGRSEYDDETRRRAVVEYCVLGNISRVAEIINVPRTTIASWKDTEWWSALYEKTLKEVNDEILANNLRIATESQKHLLDRLERGDVVRTELKTNEDGEPAIVEVRQPVRARDLSVIGGIAQDKARVQLGQPTSISGSSSEAIKGLAAQFEQLSRAHNEKIVSEQ